MSKDDIIDRFTDDEIQKETDEQVTMDLIYNKIKLLDKKINAVGEIVTDIAYEKRYDDHIKQMEELKNKKEEIESDIASAMEDKDYYWTLRKRNLENFED